MARTIALLQPDGSTRLGDALLAALKSPDWDRVLAAVAFVKYSGARHLAGALQAFARRTHGAMRIAIGIDQQGSSLDGVQLLWQAVQAHGGQIFIVRNPIGKATPTFHPKTWLFSGPKGYLVCVGSGNITEGGLYTNYEMGMCLEVGTNEQAGLISSVEQTLLNWTDPGEPEVVQLTTHLLQSLHHSGELPSEAALRRAQRLVRAARASITNLGAIPKSGVHFRGRPVPTAPQPPPLPTFPPPPVKPDQSPPVPTMPVPVVTSTASARAQIAHGAIRTSVLPMHKVLYMVVAPRNKTELYLTKGVLGEDPAFFGAPFMGLTTPKKASNPGQPQADPQPSVSITIHGRGSQILHRKNNHALKMWVYANGPSANQDFRITLPQELLRDVPDDSILMMERDPPGPDGFDYSLDFFPKTNAQYSRLLVSCVHPIPGGRRRYGWM